MPTAPKTSCFASVTNTLPGPTILSTRSMLSVPKASAAIACAPPAATTSRTPSRCAAAATSGCTPPDGAGGLVDHDALDARNLRGDHRHEHGAGIGRAPAGNVAADPPERHGMQPCATRAAVENVHLQGMELAKPLARRRSSALRSGCASPCHAASIAAGSTWPTRHRRRRSGRSTRGARRRRGCGRRR